MPAKHILVTAFDPFGGEKMNSAAAALALLPERLQLPAAPAAEIRLDKKLLPTSFARSGRELTAILKAAEQPYDALIHLGQAAGRSRLSLERLAINLDDAAIADNDGVRPEDRPIIPDGPAAYFSSLPLKKLCRRLREAGLPAEISNSAGTFVCNHLMYLSLHACAGGLCPPSCLSGFIHLPLLPEQAAEKAGLPSWPASLSAQALTLILIVLTENMV